MRPLVNGSLNRGNITRPCH